MEETNEDRLSDVRKNVARYRKERHLNQAELAELVSLEGVKFFPQTVQKIENGTRTVRLDEAVAIAAALGTSVSDLLRPVDSPIVELERARRQAHQARDAGVDGLVAWLMGIRELINVMSLIRESEIEIPAEDLDVWNALVRESEVMRGESVQDVLRTAKAKLSKVYSIKDAHLILGATEEVEDSGAVDPEAS